MISQLEYSPLESSRFELRVARGTFEEIDERRLAREILDQRLDVAIIRVPTNQTSAIHRLIRSGLHGIHADTLVYYETDLRRIEPAALRNADLEFSAATEEDGAALEELIDHTFAGYQSHYHANPRFPDDAILAGYRQWAQGYVGAEDGRQTWVARRNGMIVAFACCRGEADGETCEGVLYGVHPDHSGGGLYGDLIRYLRFRRCGLGKDLPSSGRTTHSTSTPCCPAESSRSIAISSSAMKTSSASPMRAAIAMRCISTTRLRAALVSSSGYLTACSPERNSQGSSAWSHPAQAPSTCAPRWCSCNQSIQGANTVCKCVFLMVSLPPVMRRRLRPLRLPMGRFVSSASMIY